MACQLDLGYMGDMRVEWKASSSGVATATPPSLSSIWDVDLSCGKAQWQAVLIYRIARQGERYIIYRSSWCLKSFCLYLAAMAGSESIHDTSCHGMPIGSRIHGRHESWVKSFVLGSCHSNSSLPQFHLGCWSILWKGAVAGSFDIPYCKAWWKVYN